MHCHKSNKHKAHLFNPERFSIAALFIPLPKLPSSKETAEIMLSQVSLTSGPNLPLSSGVSLQPLGSHGQPFLWPSPKSNGQAMAWHHLASMPLLTSYGFSQLKPVGFCLFCASTIPK